MLIEIHLPQIRISDSKREKVCAVYPYLLFIFAFTFVSSWGYYDHLFGIVVSTSDCHPKGPGFDSRQYPRNFSGSIGSGTGSTQPREDNIG